MNTLTQQTGTAVRVHLKNYHSATAPVPTTVRRCRKGRRGMGHFPASQPTMPTENMASLVTILHETNWMHAREFRQLCAYKVESGATCMHEPKAQHQDKGHADQYIAHGHIWELAPASSNMGAYVQEATPTGQRE